MRFVLALLTLALFTTGCGETLPSVGGTVTIDDRPVVSGTISLEPVAGGPTVGSQVENGKYQIDKLAVGKYRTIVTAYQQGQFAESSADLEAAAGKPPQLFRDLAEGAEGNGVEVEIQPGSQTLDFSLRSKGR